MQKGNLEQFVSQHREAFDIAVPDLKVWSTIDRELHPPQKSVVRIFRMRLSNIAAAIFFLGIIGVGIYTTQKSTLSSATVALHEISKEHAEMENYFRRQINQKVSLLESYNYHDQSLEIDLAQIDESLKELEEELKHVPAGSEEMVINAMIQSYQVKLELLERVLEYIQSANSKNEKENEKISI